MAESTRMRTSSSTAAFIRVAESSSGDMAVHDVGTSDAAVSGIGGTGEFEIASTADATYATGHVVHTTSSAALGSGAISKFVSIKHTGFTSAAKSTATTTGTCLVTLGGLDAATYGGFTLVSGEQITLHGMNTEANNLSKIFIICANESVYVEVVYL
jgi:hypothetical protein